MPEREQDSLSRSEVTFELARAVMMGGVAVQGEGLDRVELAAIQESGEASLFKFESPYFGVDAVATRGLKLAGVMRRKLIRRHFMEVKPSEVKKGDRLVLVDEEDVKIKTARMNSVTTDGLFMGLY